MTKDQIIQFNNLKVVNKQRPWQYYRKMVRNVAVNPASTTRVSIQNTGYFPTEEPIGTQQILLFVEDNFGPSPTATDVILRSTVTTYFMAFKGRR